MAYDEPLKDPQNPAITDYCPETTPLGSIIEEAIQAHALDLRVCLPCTVAKVHASQQIDVRPTLRARYATSDKPVDLPIIQNVPVSMPMGADYHIRLPVAEGDAGMLIFCDRSLDAWSQSVVGQAVDPADSRAHDLTDPIFVPGLVPFASQIKDVSTDLVLRNGDMAMRLQKNGRIRVGSTAMGGQELFDLLGQVVQGQIDLLNLLQTQTFTMTLLGPQPPIGTSIAAFAKLQGAMKKLLQDSGTLKSQ